MPSSPHLCFCAVLCAGLGLLHWQLYMHADMALQDRLVPWPARLRCLSAVQLALIQKNLPALLPDALSRTLTKLVVMKINKYLSLVKGNWELSK